MTSEHRRYPAAAMVSDALTTLAPGVSVWLADAPGHGRTNAGVVVDADGITVIDTLLTPAAAVPLARALDELGRRVRRVVYTSSHIEFTGGSTCFPLAARYGRAQTSALLDQPPNAHAWSRLHPGHDDEFAEMVTRPVSHTVSEAAWLSPAVTAIPVAGQQFENLVVHVPAADVLFAGALCCFGATPLAFDGDPEAWADGLGDIAALASTIVPGIGPVGGPDEVLAQQAYLYACVDAAAEGGSIPAGPWDSWSDRRFDAVNIERAAMLGAGDASPPPAMLQLLGLG